jgi:hypothetical protein
LADKTFSFISAKNCFHMLAIVKKAQVFAQKKISHKKCIILDTGEH